MTPSIRSATAFGSIPKLLTYLALTGMVAITLYPLLWLVFGSLKSEAEFYRNTWAPPAAPLWGNYATAWEQAGLGVAFINSLVVTVVTTATLVLMCAMAAYAFARVEFPLRQFWFWLFLISLMVPTAVLAIPTFIAIKQFGLLDTRLSLILTYTAGGLGFGIFLMRAYFYSIPVELEEAAMLDGASRFTVFWQIVMPLAKPGLATLVIWHGLNSWNEFFLASILVRSAEMRTWPLAVVTFVFERQTRWELMFATLAIATIPVVILYTLAQKQFISGLAAGSVKG